MALFSSQVMDEAELALRRQCDELITRYRKALKTERVWPQLITGRLQELMDLCDHGANADTALVRKNHLAADYRDEVRACLQRLCIQESFDIPLPQVDGKVLSNRETKRIQKGGQGFLWFAPQLTASEFARFFRTVFENEIPEVELQAMSITRHDYWFKALQPFLCTAPIPVHTHQDGQRDIADGVMTVYEYALFLLAIARRGGIQTDFDDPAPDELIVRVSKHQLGRVFKTPAGRLRLELVDSLNDEVPWIRVHRLVP